MHRFSNNKSSLEGSFPVSYWMCCTAVVRANLFLPCFRPRGKIDPDFTCCLSAPRSVSCAWGASYKRGYERTQRARPGRARLRTSSSAGDEGCHSDPRTTPDRRPQSRDIPARRKRFRVQPYEKVRATVILGTQTVVYHSHLSPPSVDIRALPLRENTDR